MQSLFQRSACLPSCSPCAANSGEMGGPREAVHNHDWLSRVGAIQPWSGFRSCRCWHSGMQPTAYIQGAKLGRLGMYLNVATGWMLMYWIDSINLVNLLVNKERKWSQMIYYGDLVLIFFPIQCAKNEVQRMRITMVRFSLKHKITREIQ